MKTVIFIKKNFKNTYLRYYDNKMLLLNMQI